MKRICAKAVLLILFAFPTSVICAQQKKYVPLIRQPDTAKNIRPDSVNQKDIGDVFDEVFHEKPSKTKIDTVGSKPVISVIPALGYALQSRLAILLSGNMAFRTAPESRISTIIASAAYTQNKQFTLPIQSSIWNRTNDYNLVGEMRFYRYPQSTFGLAAVPILRTRTR